MGLIDNIKVRVGGYQDILNALSNYVTVVLKPNILDEINTLEQILVNEPNTKYVVKWNYDLQGQTIILPENCLIEFDGGSFSNGTLIGNNTIIISYQDNSDILKDVNLEGTFTFTRDSKKLDLTLSTEPLELASNQKIVQEYKKVTITDGDNNSVSFNTIILDITDLQVYTLSIDLDEGILSNYDGYTLENGLYSTEIIEGNSIVVPIPTRLEYEFQGWYTNSDFLGEIAYQGGEEIIFGTERGQLNENITLYAKWVKVNYTVTFDLNYESRKDISYKPSGESLTFSTPTRTGYTFLKWNTIADGTGTSYNAGDTIIITSNITFYAIWQINQYTVTFNSNYPNSEGEQTVTTAIYDYNTPVSSINFPSFTYEGYSLVSWNVSANGAGTNPTHITENGIIFYAQWELQNQYYLTTSIPTSIPNWSNSILNTISFGQLEGWSDWEGQENQYLVLPSEEGKIDISDYIDVTENNFGTSLLDGFEEIESSVQGIIVLQWNGFSPIEDSEHTFLTFK